MGTDSGDHFRAESRDKDNEVKGVYSWIDPSGDAHTVAYNSGKNGHRTVPLSSSGIVLPPFPYSLYGNVNQARTNNVPDLRLESKNAENEPQLYTPPITIGNTRPANIPIQTRPAPIKGRQSLFRPDAHDRGIWVIHN